MRIGGASGSFVDSATAVPQLLQEPQLDYIVFDYLAEGSMAIFGRMIAADPRSGFIQDFVDVHVGPFLKEIVARGVKVVANAGGLNPRGLAASLQKRAEEMGVKLRVAVVLGDDLRSRADEFRAAGVRDMFDGGAFPAKPTSLNAYLGAFPIAAALDAGADVVLTGRVVDSAIVLGPLIHEFGWQADRYDLLAAGTVAGHLLECGAQVSGGTFTDWQDVPDWADSGFPIGECHPDGSVVITKAPGSGGLVSVGTVAEQMLYEVGDPQRYFVPDVTVDFTPVKVEQVGPDRVRVSGARGYAPTGTLKVCGTWDDGWRSSAAQPIIGADAPAKAKRQAEAIVERCRRMLKARGWADFRQVHIEVVGTEATFGSHARPVEPREVVARIVVDHDDPRAAWMFWREQVCAIMGMSVGTAIGLASPVAPLTHIFLALVDKSAVKAEVEIDGTPVPFEAPRTAVFDSASVAPPAVPAEPRDVEAGTTVPLVSLAWARSGDKGNLFNVGVIARRPGFLPYLRAALTPQAVAQWYAHFLPATGGRVDRHDVPGVHGLNLVVHDALAGGINTSPRLDAAAKGMAQQLLEFPVPVSREIAAAVAAASARS